MFYYSTSWTRLANVAAIRSTLESWTASLSRVMQELEHSAPTGLIIATSNLARHLDDVLWRRFDLALEFKSPSSQVLRPFANRLAKIHRVDLPPKVIQDALRARSFAMAESIVISETRRQILDNA